MNMLQEPVDAASQLQIRLFTKQESLAVPDVPLSVPSSIEVNSLNEVLNRLLKESKSDFLKPKEFDFLAFGELIRVPLSQHLHERGISSEYTVDVEYIDRTPAPEPQNCLLHDDWVSGIHTLDNWILTACYDHSINIWTTHGKLVTSLKEHSNIVKKVVWLNLKGLEETKRFISVSHDLTAIMYEWEVGTDDVKPIIVFRGHERGIDDVGISPNVEKIATGGWDTNLKIWSTDITAAETDEPASKKSKGLVNIKTPLHTLKGHKEAISSVGWISGSEIFTGSMDHTVKFWDAELCGLKNEIVGQKAFLGTSWSHLNRTLLTCSADRHIRLYDPRSSEGSICKQTYTSHTLWVSSLDWSKTNEYLFVSAGYDSCVKLWDTRSSKAPLYNLQGHQGQVLAVDWSNNKYVMSGGCDNSLHIFKNNV